MCGEPAATIAGMWWWLTGISVICTLSVPLEELIQTIVTEEYLVFMLWWSSGQSVYEYIICVKLILLNAGLLEHNISSLCSLDYSVVLPPWKVATGPLIETWGIHQFTLNASCQWRLACPEFQGKTLTCIMWNEHLLTKVAHSPHSTCHDQVKWVFVALCSPDICGYS